MEDLRFAAACVAGDAAELKKLEGILASKLPRWIARVGSSEALVSETRQRLWVSLVVEKNLSKYAGRGPLEAWLRVTALRTALAVARETRNEDVPVPEELEAGTLDPELALMKRKYGAELNAAFEHALRALGAEQRNVLRLHYLDELTIEEVATATRVSRATAARRLSEARTAVASATMMRLKERLEIDTKDADSLLALVQSQIDPALGALIGRG